MVIMGQLCKSKLIRSNTQKSELLLFVHDMFVLKKQFVHACCNLPFKSFSVITSCIAIVVVIVILSIFYGYTSNS